MTMQVTSACRIIRQYRIEATAFAHRGQVLGSSGIDRAVVARLHKTGEAVVVWDIANGDIHCDISDPGSVSASVETTAALHGPPTRERWLAADLDREPDDVAAGGRRTLADETGEGRVTDDVGCRRPHHARGVRRLARSLTAPTV